MIFLKDDNVLMDSPVSYSNTIKPVAYKIHGYQARFRPSKPIPAGSLIAINESGIYTAIDDIRHDGMTVAHKIKLHFCVYRRGASGEDIIKIFTKPFAASTLKVGGYDNETPLTPEATIATNSCTLYDVFQNLDKLALPYSKEVQDDKRIINPGSTFCICVESDQAFPADKTATFRVVMRTYGQ